MTTIPVPAPARRRMLPSPGVTAVAVLAILFGTVGVLGIAHLVRPASAERNRTATATATAAATGASAPPVAIVHASTIALGPHQVTVARGGTLQLMNMGTEPVRLALQGTKTAVTVPAGDVANLALTGLKPGRYTLQAQRPDGRPTALTMRVTVAR